MMTHDHVKIAVVGSSTSGGEVVPAQQLDEAIWLLLQSPCTHWDWQPVTRYESSITKWVLLNI